MWFVEAWGAKQREGGAETMRQQCSVIIFHTACNRDMWCDESCAYCAASNLEGCLPASEAALPPRIALRNPPFALRARHTLVSPAAAVLTASAAHGGWCVREMVVALWCEEEETAGEERTAAHLCVAAMRRQ